MLVRRRYPEPVGDVSVDEVYSGLDWQPRADRPYMALNMVSSVDGRATLQGAAAGIGSRVDHALMMALRANADALLHGAGTLRADRVGKGVPDKLVPRRIARGLAPQPILSVLTASGDVPLERALFAEPERVVVFVAARTPPAAVARLRARATVKVAGDERPDPAQAVRILGQEYGVRHILCEGGPALNRSLIAAGVLDELFLTLAPKLLAGDELPLIVGSPFAPPMPLRLRSLYEYDGELFLRYALHEAQKVDG